MTDDTPDRCTISMDNRKLCGKPVILNAPIPICFEHGASIMAFLADRFNESMKVYGHYGPRVVAAMSQSMTDRRGARRRTLEANAVVYYVRVGDMVKIGTTTVLKARMRAYPPGSELLATEPGGEATERDRLQQFADCLVAGNEWFAPTVRLMEHIDSLRNAA